MTVQELIGHLSLETFHMADPARAVTGGYAGDLLSWVLSRAQTGDGWLTIMSNQNVAAVALMADVSCVILADGVVPDDDLLRRGREKEINLLGTGKSVFAAAAALQRLLE